jgi:hypothetical protein
MSGQYLLGLDNGGTFVKAGLYRASGEAAAFASQEVPAILGRGGIVERDMDALWAANCNVIREAIVRAGILPRDIACVSVSGHGNGLYLVDEALRPVMNGICSAAMRANEICSAHTNASKWFIKPIVFFKHHHCGFADFIRYICGLREFHLSLKADQGVVPHADLHSAPLKPLLPQPCRYAFR